MSPPTRVPIAGVFLLQCAAIGCKRETQEEHFHPGVLIENVTLAFPTREEARVAAEAMREELTQLLLAYQQEAAAQLAAIPKEAMN